MAQETEDVAVTVAPVQGVATDPSVRDDPPPSAPPAVLATSSTMYVSARAPSSMVSKPAAPSVPPADTVLRAEREPPRRRRGRPKVVETRSALPAPAVAPPPPVGSPAPAPAPAPAPVPAPAAASTTSAVPSGKDEELDLDELFTEKATELATTAGEKAAGKAVQLAKKQLEKQILKKMPDPLVSLDENIALMITYLRKCMKLFPAAVVTALHGYQGLEPLVKRRAPLELKQACDCVAKNLGYDTMESTLAAKTNMAFQVVEGVGQHLGFENIRGLAEEKARDGTFQTAMLSLELQKGVMVPADPTSGMLMLMAGAVVERVGVSTLVDGLGAAGSVLSAKLSQRASSRVETATPAAKARISSVLDIEVADDDESDDDDDDFVPEETEAARSRRRERDLQRERRRREGALTRGRSAGAGQSRSRRRERSRSPSRERTSSPEALVIADDPEDGTCAAETL